MDEEIPSHAQQRQLLNAHVNLGHPAIVEFCRPLRNGQCRRGIVRWTKRHFHCPECEARPMTRTRARLVPKKTCKVQGSKSRCRAHSTRRAAPQAFSLFSSKLLELENRIFTTGLLATARTCPGGSGQQRTSWATPVESNSEQWPLTE